MKKGIDVSKWQGVIDWEKVKADGIEFAILRASYGDGTLRFTNNGRDEQFERNYQEAKRVGIPIGVYHYCYARNMDEMKKEAEFFLSVIKGKTFEYPVILDLEDKNQQSISKADLTDMAIAFLEILEKNGYYAMLYANKHWLENKLDYNRLKKFDIWLAQWSKKPTWNGSFGIWQYTSDGSIDGIQGRVDMNISYKDYPTIIRQAGLNRLNEEKEEHDMSNQPNQYIIAIQAALRDHGIDIGLVDGIAGPKTLEGVRQAVNRMTAAERELDKLKNSNNDVRLEQAKEYARKILDI